MQTENPRPEDVECLAKLVTTVGKPLDSSKKSQQFIDDNGVQAMTSTKDLMAVSGLE